MIADYGGAGSYTGEFDCACFWDYNVPKVPEVIRPDYDWDRVPQTVRVTRARPVPVYAPARYYSRGFVGVYQDRRRVTRQKRLAKTRRAK
jgi:hypothetical protein